MVQRTRRSFSEADQDQLIAAIDVCKRAGVAAMTKAPINGPAYRAATRLSQALDQAIEELTGQSTLFREPGHGTHANCLGRPTGGDA